MAAPWAFCGMNPAPRLAEIDATLTIDPAPRSSIDGHTAFVTRNTMSSSRAMVNRQSSNDSSSSGANRIAPALFTRTSQGP